MSEEDPRVKLFASIGLQPDIAKQTLNNKKVSAQLEQAIKEVKMRSELLVQLALLQKLREKRYVVHANGKSTSDFCI